MNVITRIKRLLTQRLPLIMYILVFASTLQAVDGTSASQTKAPDIIRAINATKNIRRFPRLPDGRNTSIQKAPAPALAGLSEREFGRPRITKCWLNLDEMWDYRTKEYDYNHLIGVHKYDGIKEKHGETWGGVKETSIPFPQYLKAFSKHSDEVMLTIRRYERDILDGKLGVTMDDWREMFKNAVVHYRTICPNLKYIEVCNEYALKGFIGCDDKEYYSFYTTACQAMDAANKELELTGEDRVLVGGPAVTGDIIKKIDLFCENFKNDKSETKRLDFVSWHEYNKPYQGTALREGIVQALLAKHNLKSNLPMYITEHDPYHPKAGSPEYNLKNGAGLVKSLYFTNIYSPGITLMPWVQYHIGKIQTRFMWFDGPNEPDTRAEELRMLPAGCSMKLLSLHREWELAVDNGLERDEIVLASIDHQGMALHAVNYGAPRKVHLHIAELNKVFNAPGTKRLRFVKYMIDGDHSNAVTDPSYPGGIEKIEEGNLILVNGEITLSHSTLAQNGILMWIIKPEKQGTTPLFRVADNLSTISAIKPGTVFDVRNAPDYAVAENDASIELVDSKFHVTVSKSEERPGITYRPSTGEWNMSDLKQLSAKVRNTGKNNLSVHLVIDGVEPDRTHRKNCVIASVNIPAGEEKPLNILIAPPPPSPVKWLTQGKGEALPHDNSLRMGNFNASKVTAISIYVYKPSREYTYEVSELKGIK